MKTLTIILVLAVSMLSAQENLQSGLTAYQKGDYATAYKILRPLAYQANPQAMLTLGRMYELGQGVQKDEILAFSWYLLAIEEGDVEADHYLMPLEERLGDRLDEAMERADALRQEIANRVANSRQAGKQHSTDSPNQPLPYYSENQVQSEDSDFPPTMPSNTSQPGTSPRGFQTEWVPDQSGPVSLRRPADWQLHPIRQDGQIRLSSPSGETLVVWPFYLRQRLTSSGATALLQRMVTLVDPGVQCGNAQSISTNAVRCWGKNRNNTTVSGMSWTDGSGFSAGYFYYVSGPEKTSRQNRQLYVEILRSLTIRGSGQMNQSGSVPTRPRLQYQRWQDPVEQAFTMEVPRGWQTRGGLVRRAAVDVTAAVQIISPDGQIRLFVGDANVPVFTIPDQTLAWTGFTEGSWYSPGYGVKMMVMRYKPGVNFASEYVQSAFGQHCGGLQITSSRDLPEASQAINRIYQQYNMPGFVQQLTTGEVRFSCQSGGRPQAGYCFAGTEVLQAYGSGIWTVKYLFGYLAPRERASEAETALAHLASSLQMNPAWVQMQQGLTGNVSRITTETGNYISNLINSSYESQQRSQDEMARRYSNYIRGTEDVRDPNTGETYKVESSSNYYWIDASRTIVGTDLDANPDVTRFEQMIRLP